MATPPHPASTTTAANPATTTSDHGIRATTLTAAATAAPTSPPAAGTSSPTTAYRCSRDRCSRSHSHSHRRSRSQSRPHCQSLSTSHRHCHCSVNVDCGAESALGGFFLQTSLPTMCPITTSKMPWKCARRTALAGKTGILAPPPPPPCDSTNCPVAAPKAPPLCLGEPTGGLQPVSMWDGRDDYTGRRLATTGLVPCVVVGSQQRESGCCCLADAISPWPLPSSPLPLPLPLPSLWLLGAHRIVPGERRGRCTTHTSS